MGVIRMDYEEYFYDMMDMQDEQIDDLDNQINDLQCEINDLKETIEIKDEQIKFLVDYIVRNINKDFKSSKNKYSKGLW